MSNKLKIKFKYLILFILIVITVFTANMASSRFSSELENTAGELSVARPVVEVQQVSANSIEDMLPGDTAEYRFNIRNTDDTYTSEVTMGYYIEVALSSNDIPLTYTLYDTTSGSSVPVTITNGQTSTFYLGHDNAETHNYKIEFSWPIAYNDASYADEEVSFTIDVYAEQVVS